MYSGTTLNRFSGQVLVAHQKIDRVARRRLDELLPAGSHFPSIKTILHFEGNNGPDGIKRKSPAKDEPWHFFNPFDESEAEIIGHIENHYQHLIDELRAKNNERAAFEASWLAHAIVDGLTPAHHYPYEAQLVELRGGLSIETRTSFLKKAVMPGATPREMIRNNWKMWGAKGLLMTHWWFEFGVSVLIKPLSFKDVKVTKHDINQLIKFGVVEIFKRRAKEVAILDMYDKYYKHGWTPKLAYDVRHKLGPIIIEMVTLAWLGAVLEAATPKP